MSATTSAAAAAPLQIIREGAVATLRFSRPEAMNAIDVPMAQALLAAVQELAADPGVRAVVLCGAGKAFMAGGDLATLRADPVQGAANLLGTLNAAVQVLATMNAPVIAKVHGAAAGAGLSLMLQADFVIAAEGTRFSQLEVGRGVMAVGGATLRMAERAGWGNAMKVLLTGYEFTPAEALRFNFIQEIVPEGKELDRALELAGEISRQAPLAVQATLRNVRRAFLEGPDAAISDFVSVMQELALTEDAVEGVKSFQEKRPPVYRGR